VEFQGGFENPPPWLATAARYINRVYCRPYRGNRLYCRSCRGNRDRIATENTHGFPATRATDICIQHFANDADPYQQVTP